MVAIAERISVSEAGLRLGLIYQTVHRMVQRGQLEGGKDDRGWWVSLASVEREAARRKAAELTRQPEAAG